ncbi:MAG: 4Fe-4S dicluster domain-containing protein [Caldiserica bacterium]|jgi:ferredoxin|nr:4Fe-4S dicluster domain-containing protein [Caldisericota bacterium]MDH7561792.1 4Fe-4S dicluster domain-containing protein [Caldisericota bacterium]
MSTDDLVLICEQAFTEKKLDVFLGYERSPSGFLRPAVFSSLESLKELKWDPSASLNLASLLPRFKGKKVGIVAPGCVSRSLVILINEGQLVRENLTVVGVPCQGLIDRKNLTSFSGAKFIGSGEGSFFLEKEGKILELPLKDYLSESCLECPFPDPVFFDLKVSGNSKEPGRGSLQRRVEELAGLTEGERLNYFKNEAEKCIRCYGCRQACPMCYCESCFVENSEPRWLHSVPQWPDNLIWLFTRVYHLAGRCVQCGSCARACPEGVDLMSLLYFSNQTVLDLFQFQPGLKIGEKPAFGEYRLDDPDFFWGGGKEEGKKCCS